MQVLYLDILFFLNTIMNLFIFRVATIISNEKVKLSKLIMAAIVSSLIYCMGLLIPILRQIPMGIYQCFIPVISVVYLFKCPTVKVCLKKIVLVNGVAWIMGGIGFNLYYMVEKNLNSVGGSIFIPISSGVVMLIVVEIGYTFIRHSIVEPKYVYDLTLEEGNSKLNIIGYLDTGNTLYTMSHQPVILVEYEQIVHIVSEEYKQVLEVCREGVVIEKIIEYQRDIKLYLIPFTSVGCKDSILIGIPISIITLSRGRYKEVIEDAVVGVCYHPLFKDRRYQALIHPDVIQ